MMVVSDHVRQKKYLCVNMPTIQYLHLQIDLCDVKGHWVLSLEVWILFRVRDPDRRMMR